MSGQADLEKRLRFFGIDSQTKHIISDFLPLLLPRIEEIADRFYGYTLNFPEAQKLLAPHYSNKSLKQRQVKHWVRLFSCRFNEDFYKYALKIGQVHYANKIYPYLYIGGYNFIQCELMNLISNHYKESARRSAMLSAVNRLIALDMDLALSAYTREHWLQRERGSAAETVRCSQISVEDMYVC